MLPWTADFMFSTVGVLVLVTKRAAWTQSFSMTSTPSPQASRREASKMALYRLRGPSALKAELGRTAPVSTTGLLLLIVRFRKYAVSSSVSVPCVITTPSIFGSASSLSTCAASFSSILLVKQRLSTLNACWHWMLASDVIKSEGHTSELQSLMRISYAVFCLK